MMKKLIKKAAAIIIAAMLIASISAVGISATEKNEEKTGVVTADTANTYIDEETGVKFESDAMTITSDNVTVTSHFANKDLFGFYEDYYFVDIKKSDDEYIDFNKVPITLYLPSEKENCYVLLHGNDSFEYVQIDAEYVDGYYKFRVENTGNYYICDTPLINSYSTLEQQTLTDEDTGVSVSGVIETNSNLVAYDVRDMYENFKEENYDLCLEPFAMIDEFDGYGVFFSRNMKPASTQGELTISLPCANEGYEVRYINDSISMSDKDGCEAEILGFQLTTTPELPAEEVAERYTALMDSIYPALDAEYVNGSYVVKSELTGYYFIAPKGSFTITADKINKVRAAYQKRHNGESSSLSVESNDTSTDDSKEATKVQPITTKKATESKSDNSKSTDNDKNIIVTVIAGAVVLVVIGTTVVLICKKKSAKK